MKKPKLITGALNYANGDLHLGHMVEQVQVDIWARYWRLQDHPCFLVGGIDAHGTPIMINAEKQGITPEQLIEKAYQSHCEDLKGFNISYDNYYTTHSNENQQWINQIYQAMAEKGDIEKKTIEQAYDEQKQLFLPDRYVKGTCPKCSAEDQYSDGCEVCGATYSGDELLNPKSILSNQPPITKASEHYFFCLNHYQDFLQEWINAGHVAKPVANKLAEWFKEPLKQWDISRDAPYFGFTIPGETDKYFYVWLDAPTGYIASFDHLISQHHPEINIEDYWKTDQHADVYHFIGKDIVYFHALFWPAMLTSAGLRTPTEIFVHGFLTINGKKMSKSRGTFISAKRYLEQLDPDYLRYYFASKLNDNVEDIDLNLEDFVQKVNADLVGKTINIASRSAGFIHKLFDGKLTKQLDPDQQQLLDQFISAGDDIGHCYENRQYQQATRKIMALADLANQYVDQQKPWVMAKQSEQHPQVQQACSLALNLFRQLMVYLQPIVPGLAERSAEFLNCSLDWLQRKQALIDHQINPFKPLLKRLDLSEVNQLIDHGDA